MGMIEQRMGSPNLSPEEKQSLNSMLQNVTEEYSALRAIYPNVAIPTPSEQQPPMGYPNAQGSSMPVYAMPPAASIETAPAASSDVASDVAPAASSDVASDVAPAVSSGVASEATSTVPAEAPSESQASFPELPKLEDDAIAQEEPMTERTIVNDIKHSWDTGVNNMKEYMKDPHVSGVVVA